MSNSPTPEQEQSRISLEQQLEFYKAAFYGPASLELSTTQKNLLRDFCSDWKNALAGIQWYLRLHPDDSTAVAEIGRAVHVFSQSLVHRQNSGKKKLFRARERTYLDDVKERLSQEDWLGVYSFYGKIFGINPAPVATDLELGLLITAAYAAAEPLRAGNRQLSIEVVMLGAASVGNLINERLPKPIVLQATLGGATIEVYVNPGPEISWNRKNHEQNLTVDLFEDCILIELFEHLKINESFSPGARSSFEKLYGHAPVVQWSPPLESVDFGGVTNEK
jgi:hypothetical protein